MKVSLLAVDLAKSIFQIHGVDEKGKAVLKRKLRRPELVPYIANIPPCRIVMEACGSSYHWARRFQAHGHEVLLISPQFVKPFVKTNKNDAADAEAIAEAASRPNMRFVPLKQLWQQDVQCLHRIRQRLVKNRTALSNEIRGLLNEYGIVFAQGFSSLRKNLSLALADESNDLSLSMRQVFSELLQELSDTETQIESYDAKIQQVFEKNESCQRIRAIKGIGPITATAILAAVGDPKVFQNGRQFSAWLGLVPRQYSSGGKNSLFGISKRGDTYLRSLLIHGARAALKTAPYRKDRLSLWALQKQQSRGFNKAAVALANKHARIIWALLAHQKDYEVRPAELAA